MLGYSVISGSASATSPITSVRRIRPLAKVERFQPGIRRRHRAVSSSAWWRSAGHTARASVSSCSSSGYFSTLKKSRLLVARATSSKSCQAHKKLKPVPNPVSPIVNPPPLDKDAKRSASRLPCKKYSAFLRVRNPWKSKHRRSGAKKAGRLANQAFAQVDLFGLFRI